MVDLKLSTTCLLNKDRIIENVFRVYKILIFQMKSPLFSQCDVLVFCNANKSSCRCILSLTLWSRGVRDTSAPSCLAARPITYLSWVWARFGPIPWFPCSLTPRPPDFPTFLPWPCSCASAPVSRFLCGSGPPSLLPCDNTAIHHYFLVGDARFSFSSNERVPLASPGPFLRFSPVSFDVLASQVVKTSNKTKCHSG